MKFIEFKPTVDWANYALEKVGIDNRLEYVDKTYYMLSKHFIALGEGLKKRGGD